MLCLMKPKQVCSLLFFIILSQFAFPQEIVKLISDQINDQTRYTYVMSCWGLSPDSTIRPLKLNSGYVGRVVLLAYADTSTLKLNKFEFVFVKLKSKGDPRDSVEIRLSKKAGNYQFFESVKPQIIEHLQYLRIKRTGNKGCDNNGTLWKIPLKIE